MSANLATSVSPCLDIRCPVHARGADPARASLWTCARQILRAHDRADAIALLGQESPPPDLGSSRVILQLRSSSPLGTGQSERLTPIAPAGPPRRPIHYFRAERLLLGANDDSWRVDDFLLGGRSQIAPHGRLPAEMFSNRVAGAGLRVFDRIAAPLQVELAVTRVHGTNPKILIGAILGSATYEPRTLAVNSGARVRQGASVQIDHTCAQSVEVHQLVIEDGGDWIIHDVEIDERSTFVQSGDLPGEMFLSDVLDSFASFGVIRNQSHVRIHATYVGYDPEGSVFRGEFRGQEPDAASHEPTDA